MAEGDERRALLLGRLSPALGAEDVGVGAPDGGRVVDRVGGHGQHRALREVVVVDGYAGPRRDLAGQAEGGGRVDAHGFFDDGVETGGRC